MRAPVTGAAGFIGSSCSAFRVCARRGGFALHLTSAGGSAHLRSRRCRFLLGLCLSSPSVSWC
jgi:hypothetical protein